MDALYFPNLSLPGPSWTNPIALYFDRIGIISPSSYEAGLSDARTAQLIDVGIATPLFAGGFEPHDTDDAILDSLAEWWGSERRRPSPNKLYLIHEGKLAYTNLLRGLIRRKLLKRHPFEKGWLIGPEPVCMKIMTLLAGRIMEAGGAHAIVTDMPMAFETVAGGKLFGSSKPDRRIRAVTRLLPMAPWATPEQILRFKFDHGTELRRFRGFVEQLIRRTQEDEGFEARLEEAEYLREALVGELSAIGARSKGTGLAFALTKFAASVFENSLLSGAVDFLSNLHSRSGDSTRSREIRRDGLAYAAIARTALRARSSQEILA